ncbi:regulatory protein RecX [Azotosporobacter soli]|uniref:regulatory protein RecX n=1 Tax=Azotosporobacter soli TaxID=3055040 RepID=UPI0031FEDF18
MMKSISRNSCWSVAVALLARRACSNWEVLQYLKKREYEAEEIASVINRLQEYKYLDDEEFAWQLARKYSGRYGWQYVVMKLRQRGVDDSGILQRLRDKVDENVEIESARQVIKKNEKRCLVAGVFAWQKAARLLQNRGYSMAVIRRTLHSIPEADLD